jgi:DMSO/TMAO reductase YedYZ heme-binding membrane subunit
MKPYPAAAITLAVTLAYSTFRYHVYGDSSWAWFPLWTTNKALSWTAAALLASSYLVADKTDARRYGLLGFALMAWHCLVSFFLLGPEFYAKLYSGESLNTAALASLILGGAGALAFCCPAWASRAGVKESLDLSRWFTLQRIGYLGLALTAIHCLAIGLPGWLTPSKWPGGLPPITLMGFLTALMPALRFVRR